MDRCSPEYVNSDCYNLNCRYCNKLCKNKNSLVQHEIRCKENPDRISVGVVPVPGFNDVGRRAWNKGLTKESDSRVDKISSSQKAKIPHSELSYSLDDDGELYNKYRQKRSNALYTQKKGFNLTFEEYCQLVKEAGLVSSQLGYKGEGYVLARFNDEGSYEYGNCRFITQIENLAERKVADAWYDSLKKAQLASRQWIQEHPEEFSKRCREGYYNHIAFQSK